MIFDDAPLYTDFDTQTQLKDARPGNCPDRNGFDQSTRPVYIPVTNHDIFPGGFFRGRFSIEDFWDFMLVGLRRYDPNTNQRLLIDSRGFLRDYNYEDWSATFPRY